MVKWLVRLYASDAPPVLNTGSAQRLTVHRLLLGHSVARPGDDVPTSLSPDVNPSAYASQHASHLLRCPSPAVMLNASNAGQQSRAASGTVPLPIPECVFPVYQFESANRQSSQRMKVRQFHDHPTSAEQSILIRGF